MNQLRQPWLFITLLTFLFAWGSAPAQAAGGPTTHTASLARPTPSQPAAQLIAPGDRLAVAYFIATADAATTYTVEPGDELYLNFRYSPALSQVYVKKLLDDEEKRRQDKTPDKISILSRAYVVQPEGTLVLTGLKAPLKVAGLNTVQIAARIEAIYKESGLLQHPELNVSVDPKYKRYEALQRTLQSGVERPILTMPVPADGKLSLPLVAGVAATGKTVQALGEELTGRYHTLGFPLVTVTVWFDQIAAPARESLRILGAVKSPGTYPGPASADLWDAIALAGGFAPEADVNAVRVVGRDGKTALGPFRFDDYLASGDPKANVTLKGNELIFVPRK